MHRARFKPCTSNMKTLTKSKSKKDFSEKEAKGRKKEE